jgi:hypothetical protein
MSNLHDADSPTGPVKSDESGSSNGGSSNCRHHHTHRASSWLIVLTNCSFCTNSKSREHTARRSHVSPAKDRQATAACLHNLHSLLCTTGAPQASRAVTHQGEALRMPPMLEMLRTPRLAPAPSTEAAPAGRDFNATAQRATRKHYWASTHQLCKSCSQELHFKQRWWHHPRYWKHASSRQHHECHRYRLPNAHGSNGPWEWGPPGTFTPC